jgi:Glycosyltransferase family 87
VLLLVMFSLTFVSLKRSRDYLAGFFLGLGLFKFPVVLPFALICFLCRKWKLITGFATAALALGGLSLLVVGPGGIFTYIRMLLDALSNPHKAIFAASMKPTDMATLRGLFMLLFPGINSHWVQAIVGVTGGILIVATALLWNRIEKLQGSGPSGPAFASAIAISLVVTPHAELHDMVLMLLAVLLVLGSREWATNRTWKPILFACIGILYFPPAYLLLIKSNLLPFFCLVLVGFAISSLGLSVLAPSTQVQEPLTVDSFSPQPHGPCPE